MTRFSPPLDYLQAASRASLQNFELTRLNHAANLRQEIAVLIDQWIQETSEAMLARWMLDHFPETPKSLPNVVPGPPRFADHQSPKSALARKSPRSRQSATG